MNAQFSLRLWAMLGMLLIHCICARGGQPDDGTPDEETLTKPYQVEVCDNRSLQKTVTIAAYGPTIKSKTMEWVRKHTKFPHNPPWLGNRAVQPILVIKIWRRDYEKSPFEIHYYYGDNDTDRGAWTIRNAEVDALMKILHETVEIKGTK